MEIFLGAFTSDWEQRRAALLHDMSHGRRRQSAEEELERRLGLLGGGGGGGSRTQGRAFSTIGRSGARGTQQVFDSGPAEVASMEGRLANVARGSQPAVVKMASYGGGARAGAMLNYVSRGGELRVETESGRLVSGRQGMADVREEWEHLFQNRAESRDIGIFSLEVATIDRRGEDELGDRAREILSSGFGARRFAYRVEKRADGSARIEGLVVLRDAKGERLTGDAKAAAFVQSRYDATGRVAHGDARFLFSGYGNGVEYGTSRLRSLVAKDVVIDDRGKVLADEKAAGDLVQREWRNELHSRKGRDVMHLIMSARAGTDTFAFEGAVRDFLAQQFAGHRYVFALHDPANDPKKEGEGGRRPHVHAHAIIVMRSEAGDRIETTPAVFREWRILMAEKARAHGIQMEMTDRREFASSPAYTRNQVRPVGFGGRTQHVGTSEAAQARYDAKRGARRTLADSARTRQYANVVRQSWERIAATADDQRVVASAGQHKAFFESIAYASEGPHRSARSRADSVSTSRANLISLRQLVSEGQEMREITRPEFEAYEKSVETALFRLGRDIGAEDRADYDEIAGLAREVVNQRRELVSLFEQRKELTSDRVAEAGEQPVGDPEQTIAKVGAFVVQEIARIDARLSDRSSPDFIPEEDEVKRIEARTDREFLEDFREQLETLGTDGIIDVSRTSPAADEAEHTRHVARIVRQLEQLEALGVIVDSQFYPEPTATEERASSAAAEKTEVASGLLPTEAVERPNSIEITPASTIAAPATRQEQETRDQSSQETGTTGEAHGNQTAQAAAIAQTADPDRSFPAEIAKRYYIQQERDGTQRVFADFKAEREIFQEDGQHLRTKIDEAHTVRLMVDTAAHRGWSSINVAGTEDFRREAWIEAFARGIVVNGYNPTELDWQEVGRREQMWLRNEITPGRELQAEASASGQRTELPKDEPARAAASRATASADEARAAPASDKASAAPARESYKDGVSGTLLEVGKRNYKDNEKNEVSPYVVIATAAGQRTVWGVGLPDALASADAKVGDTINLREAGMETVRKTVIVEIDGEKRRVEKDVERRAWDAAIVEREREKAGRSGSNSAGDTVKQDGRSSEHVGGAPQTDPAKQQVPRLQQLEQEQIEKRERDRDDRER